MRDCVAVSVPMEEGWAEIVEDEIGSDVRVVLLDDVPDEERVEAIRGADALLAWNPAEEFVADEWTGVEAIELLQIMAAGVDHLEFERIPSGVTVASNAGAYAEPVAEHAVAMALALARRLREEHENMARGAFNQRRVNRSLYNADVTILGFGGIGRQIATLLEPFGPEVFAINTTGSTDRDVARCGTLEHLQDAFEFADVVFVTLPLKPSTRHLIGAPELDALGSEATLVNVARGEIIDQGALYRHLEEHETFRAGLEAWWVEPFRHGEFRLEYPFFELPNVLGAPHNSAVVPGALERGLRRAARNVRRWIDGEAVRGVIDVEAYGGMGQGT